MIDKNAVSKDLRFSGYTSEEKSALIAHKDVIEAFLRITMTNMIAEVVETREEILVCRAMKDRGIESLEAFKAEYDKNQIKT